MSELMTALQKEVIIIRPIALFLLSGIVNNSTWIIRYAANDVNRSINTSAESKQQNVGGFGLSILHTDGKIILND